MLNDKHMNAAQTILENQFPDVEGLESTLLVQSTRGFSLRSQRELVHIQIYHLNSFHWVTSVCLPNEDTVYVFDSQVSGPPYLSSNLEQQLCQIYRTKQKSLSVEIPVVQQQLPHENNCGLFAIAFATEMCFTRDILLCTGSFDESKLRQHLLECLESNHFTPFPKVKNGDFKTYNSFSEPIRVYCNCRMPEHYDKRMVQCGKCNEWFHHKCIREDKIPEKWYCSECKELGKHSRGLIFKYYHFFIITLEKEDELSFDTLRRSLDELQVCFSS